MRIFTACILLLSMTMIVEAKHCSNNSPYYHRIDTGAGSVLADLYLFPLSIGVVALTAPAMSASISKDAACLPIQLAKHFVDKNALRPNPK